MREGYSIDSKMLNKSKSRTYLNKGEDNLLQLTLVCRGFHRLLGRISKLMCHTGLEGDIKALNRSNNCKWWSWETLKVTLSSICSIYLNAHLIKRLSIPFRILMLLQGNSNLRSWELCIFRIISRIEWNVVWLWGLDCGDKKLELWKWIIYVRCKC